MSNLVEQPYVETRGPKSFNEDKRRLVRTLIGIRDGEIVITAYMKKRLVEEGYLHTYVPFDRPRTRGRPLEIFELTSKANAIINLSKGWK